MTIEQMIAGMIAALEANTAALLKASGAPAAATETTTTEKRGRKTQAAEEPKVTQDMVNAALIKIKDDFGMPAAKEVIKEFGKCEKMSEIKPATFQAVYDGAVAKHAELSADGEGSGDDGL